LDCLEQSLMTLCSDDDDDDDDDGDDDDGDDDDDGGGGCDGVGGVLSTWTVWNSL